MFDARLILGGQAADPMGAARSFSDLLDANQARDMRASQEQRTLADMATQRRRGATLNDLLTQAGPDPRSQLASLAQYPQFRKEHMELETHVADTGAKEASRLSSLEQTRKTGLDNMVRHFAGVVDDADYQRRLSMWPEESQRMMWKTWDEAKPAIEGMAAQMAARGPLIVGEDGTQYRVGSGNVGAAIKDETGKPIKKPPPSRGGRGGGAGGAVPDLTPAALDAMAQELNTTGKLPALGPGQAGMGLRVRIINRALELKPGSNLASAKSDYGADAASIRKLQTAADAVDAFEATAEKNLDTYLELAGKLVDTGSPLLNAPARQFQERVAGDPAMAGISAARLTAVTEIGKVLSGNTGAGGLTEGARHEVEALMKPDATLAQIMSAAKVLKRDMHNRKAAVSEQLAQMRARISGKPAATEGAAPALHPGEVLMLDTKGKKHAVAEKDVKAAEEHQWKRATP